MANYVMDESEEVWSTGSAESSDESSDKSSDESSEYDLLCETESFTSSSGCESDSSSAQSSFDSSSQSSQSLESSDWSSSNSQPSSMELSSGSVLSEEGNKQREQKDRPQCSRLLSVIPPSYYEPLYEGADLTILDSYILHYEFALRHRLTKQAFSELIGLVSAHLPSSESPALSVHMLQQFFVRHFDELAPISYHYCSACHRLLEPPNVVDCPNGCAAATSQFLHIPLSLQLKRRLEGMFVIARC